jgi:solute:Na+ symporter, SSS family
VLFPTAPSSPDAILPHMVLSTGLPTVVVGLFCAGALAASMSTGDALLHASASIVVEDGVRPFFRMPDRVQRLLMRLLVVAVGLVAYAFALSTPASLVRLLLSSYGVVVQLAPVVIAALYWRRATTAGALAGLLGGTGTTLVLFLNPQARPFDVHEGVYGVIVNLVLLVAVSLMSAPQSRAHADAFVEDR